MRIVIGGEDEVAFRLAEQLMSAHEVVLICPETVASARIDRLDVDTIYGVVHSTVALKQSKVSKADLFVACSPADSQNLLACVAAKRLGAAKTTCFLFRREFQVAEDDGSDLARYLGIDQVVRPSEQLAQEILRIVAVPGALDVEVFAGGKVQLLRHAVEEGAHITRAPLRDIGVPAGVVLVMARRGDEIFLPTGDTHFEAGDKLTAMGTLDGVTRLQWKYLRAASHGLEAHRATVIGGGVVGLHVARDLEGAGWQVRVIESDPVRCRQISPLMKSMVLNGDGGDFSLLEEERIADDSVLIAVTSNDEKNLLVSLIAKQLGVPRIVTRADLPQNEKLFERVGVDVVRSARGAAIQSVVRGVMHGQSELLAELEHGDAMVLELKLPEGFPPTSLIELRAPVFAIVGGILRERKVIVPRGKDAVQGEDRLLVFCTREDEAKVRDFFLRSTRRDKS